MFRFLNIIFKQAFSGFSSQMEVIKSVTDHLNKNQIISLFLFTVCYCSALNAQTYSFKNYTVEHGLAQSQVYATCQDSKGYLWFGTVNGISRFNGQKFDNYTTKDGLCGNSINVILEDSKGNIWVGTKSGAIKFVNKKVIDFDIYNYTTAHGLPDNNIRNIFEDKAGNIWFATNGGITVLLNKEKSTQSNESIKKEDTSVDQFITLTEKHGLINNRVRNIEEDSNGNLWFATFEGISILKGEKIDKEQLLTNNSLFNAFANKESTGSMRFSCIFNDSKNRMWLGSDEGITIFANDSFVKIFNNALNVPIKTIIEDKANNIWIGTQNGLAFIESKSLNKPYSNWEYSLFTLNEGLSNNLIISLTEDREGNLWIGTDGGGVLKFSGKLFESFTTKQGLNNNLVMSIAQDNLGNFVFGTFGGGISYYVPEKNFEKTGFAKQFSGSGILQSGSLINFTEDNGLLNNNVYSVIQDSEGSFWISNYGDGIIKTGLTANYKGKPQKYSTDNCLQDNRVFTMIEDKSKNIWMGTAGGITKIASNGNIQTFSTENGLKTANVISIFEDSRRNIWVGSNGGGIVLINDNVKPSVYNVVKTYAEESGLVNNFVRSITEDKNGYLFFGTNGGLSVCSIDEILTYNNKEDSSKLFTNITEKQGIYSNDIYSLIFDNENNLWIGSSNGLDKIKPGYQKSVVSIAEIKHYGLAEGFIGIETSLNAVCKDAENNLWFGTVAGAIKCNTAYDKPNTKEPLTNITRFRIFLKDTLLPMNAELPYYLNHITFDFIGICMTNPDKVRYQYKLDGFDNSWLPITQEKYATYSNLMEGDYTFKVIACNNEGIWNSVPATYTFSITPPFWRTWLFYILCVITAFSSLSAFIKLRTRNLVKAKKVLEEKVEERTLELSHKNKELAQKNKDIIDSIKYAKRIQEAILPLKKEIFKYLPHSFILYKPKDIVSGDFYWFAHKNDKSIIAGVDCTGHGVPGAFMSMIGNDLLNQFIIENSITEPGKILNLLHDGVRQALKQTESDSDTKDGMDIALCAINYKKREIEFSGALRSLFLIRKGVLTETRGERYSIGGFQREKTRTFKNHKLQLQPNDTVYIFSDGCVDQFGGAHNKKFMSSRLKNILLNIHEREMSQQALLIDKEITSWQGNYEQTDDVLMIGIKFI